MTEGAGGTDVSEFPTPPFEFEDGEGRTVEVREYDESDEEHDSLFRMYVDFDTEDRAQGIPPVPEDAIEDWLDRLLDDDESVNAVAWCEGEAVGHAMLAEEPRLGAHELAIFVLQSHQGAGVGGRLMRGALSLAYDRGVRDVWLTVERWNRAAVRLYEGVGFERVGREGFEVEMETRLTKR